jgi:hypothetical protein
VRGPQAKDSHKNLADGRKPHFLCADEELSGEGYSDEAFDINQPWWQDNHEEGHLDRTRDVEST